MHFPSRNPKVKGNKLQIPDIPELGFPKKDDKNRLAGLSRRHAALYISANVHPSGGACEKTLHKASSEVAAILGCFPAIDGDDVVLAMAAWFGLSCVVDDIFEEMPLEEGRAVLAESIQILNQGCKRSVISSTSSAPSDEIRRITAAFKDHMSSLVSWQLYQQILPTIIDFYQGLIRESLWRLSGSIDEAEYLSIRIATIGVTPFFVLMQHYFGTTSIEHVDLTSMMDSVCLAIGLQNDIIGLEKDLAEDERATYLLLLSPQDMTLDKIEARRIKAIDLHNKAIQNALHCRSMLSSQPSLKACADCLLVLVNRHFRWATSAKRYELTADDVVMLEWKTKELVATKDVAKCTVVEQVCEVGPDDGADFI